MGKVTVVGGKVGMTVPNGLPYGYTEVEYIESTGTQYIDTGFGSTHGWQAELDWMFTVAPTTEQDVIGAIYYDGSTYFREYLISRNNQWSLGLYSSYSYSGSIAANTKCNIRASTVSGNGYLYVDGTKIFEYTTTYATHTPINIYIFKMNFDQDEKPANGRLYSCKLYDETGLLVRDYVPCVNPDGEVGLYDTVNKKFHGNAGTGVFIGGYKPTGDEIKASDISVGSSVYLNENGSPVEYLVVNQGIPSGSSLYDSSCDGTWLLRKDIYEKQKWHSSNSNSYKVSTIHSYLNSTFLTLFDSVTQGMIHQVKIPYVNGTHGSAVASGANGLSSKVFLLGCYEVGWTTANQEYIPIDGACLSYFSGTALADTKRVAYLDGTATIWWLRSPGRNYQGSTDRASVVSADGNFSVVTCSSSYGVRPAVIIPKTALFDPNTMILKGVS